MERSLVERARDGDRDAFEVLVRARVDSVYGTAFTILGNASDAQDATQETFISAWRAFPGLKDPERFEAWLGRIVSNACRMSLRHRRTIRELPMDGSVDEPAVTIDGSGAATIGADLFDRAFEKLPIDQRALLVAHHLDGRTLDELASELAVPIGTVKSRLFTARAALQKALEAQA